MISQHFRSVRILWCIVAAVLPLFIQNASLAAIGEDTEKPAPEFTRAGETITAKLIPRAKSTSVLINFTANNGKLTDVKGIEFDTLQTPEIDIKEFKSSFFDMTIDDISPGSEIEIVISSSFFAISTEYWVYNAKKSSKWFHSGIKASANGDNSNQFIIRVMDGGELDSDGMADGRIQFIGGPKDHFWSYALGTLVVRFFGIFLVLSMLMVGMLSAGQIFVALDKKRARPVPPRPQTVKPAPENKPDMKPDNQTEPLNRLDDVPSAPDPDTVAAIATAIHLHLAGTSRVTADAKRSGQNSWAQCGRVEIQNARIQAFLRPVSPKKRF